MDFNTFDNLDNSYVRDNIDIKNDQNNNNIDIIKNIELKINQLNNKMEHIITLLENDVSKNCKKMGNHINFIENVYDTVHYPLNFICNKVNGIMGKNKDKLPSLQDKVESDKTTNNR
jgi:uncharacterized protein YoxC